MTIVISYDKYKIAHDSLHGIYDALSGLMQAGPDVLKNVNKWTVKIQAVHALSCLGDVMLYGMQTAIQAKNDPSYGIHDAMLEKFNKQSSVLMPKLKKIFSLCEQVLEGADLGDMAQAKAALDQLSKMTQG